MNRAVSTLDEASATAQRRKMVHLFYVEHCFPRKESVFHVEHWFTILDTVVVLSHFDSLICEN